jgi:N utilization substance protein A
VLSVEDFAERQQAEVGQFVNLFIEHLDVDESLAEVLADEGFTSLDEIAYVPMDEMLSIEGFDEDMVTELRTRAKDALLTLELASEERLEKAEPAQDLLEMDGMDRHLAFVLASRGIVTMDDLAEQAVDDISDIDELDEERAAALIMTARAPWFE